MIYHALFEHALDGMLITNDDRVSVEANPAAAALLGLEPQALTGRRIDDFLAPEEAEAFAAAWDMFLESGIAQSAIWVRRSDGARRLVEYTARAHVQTGLHLAILRDVTERQTMVEALEKTSRRLAEAEAIAHLGHWECTANGTEVSWSDELFRILGLVPGTIPPSWDGFLARVHPDDKAALLEFHEHGSKGEALPQTDYRIVRPDGTIRHLRSRGQAVTNGQGAVVGLLGTAQDITELKTAEQALRDQAGNLQAVMEAVPAVVFLAHDPDCRQISGSNGAYETLRVPRGTNLSKTGPGSDNNLSHFRVLIDGVELSSDQLPVQRAARGEEVLGFEEQVIFDDGTALWLYGNATPLHDEKGTVRGAVAAFIDLTARRHAEQALHDSEQRQRCAVEQEWKRLETVFNNLDEGLLIADPQGQTVLMNPTCLRLAGFDRGTTRMSFAEMIPLFELHDLEGRLMPVEEWPLSRVLRGEMLENDEARIRRIDTGREWDGSFNGRPVLDEDGRMVLAFVVFQDITARKQTEAALRSAKEEAERANLAKSRFLAAASHDLRQPLQSLVLFAALLEKHVDGAKGAEILAHLGQSLTAMKDLLDSLLDISRLDAGVVQPTLEDFPLRPLLDEIAAGLAPVAAAKGLAVEVTPCTAVVRSDRTLLGRIVRNLVDNAVRYTETGRIRLLSDQADGALRLEVQDTGVGIPPDHLDRIWEEFHQVGNPERNRAQGLGLGLAIVQRLSQLLGHPVTVRSRPGQGSVFGIEVPVSPAEPVSRTPVPAPVEDGSGRCAVLVEDDPLVLRGLRATLQAWGYEVLAAASADQAIERLRAAGRRPDVVIADYQLGGGRFGTEAVLGIRALFEGSIPGIVLTGETGLDSTRAAAPHGLVVLHKPVTPQTLNAVLTQQRRGLPHRGDAIA